MSTLSAPVNPIAEFAGATLRFGERTLWENVNISVEAGEFIVILGPNGAGKSTMLKALLGQVSLSDGVARVCGAPVNRGSTNIGYVPQQKTLNSVSPVRGYDLVRFGLTGHRWGINLPSRSQKARVDAAIEAVGATAYAQAPISTLSGGEQQRLRIAQALVTNPRLLLCDEPLLSLDIASQQQVVELIDRVRRSQNLGVLFVTHEINPVLPIVDRVIYIARGRALIGTPDEVLQSDVLTELYQLPVEVLRNGNRILVFADEEHVHHACEHGEA